MGEHVYTIVDKRGNEQQIVFSEGDDNYGCLCTFPYNNIAAGEEITKEDVRELAIFGALVRLVSYEFDNERDEWHYIPQSVPDWIQAGIDRVLDWNEEE